MSPPETLLKATLNRLKARIGKKLLDSATEVLELAREAPEKFQSEWELFQEEVIEEANRLEKEEKEKAEEVHTHAEDSEKTKTKKMQDKVNQIRTKVANLSSNIEAKN